MLRMSVAAALSLLALPVLAQGEEVTVPPGQAACISLKYAKDYAGYSVKAPEFAADLIDRAACFQVKEPTTGVALSSAEGFDKVKLITGHTIWVPAIVKPSAASKLDK